MEVYSNLFNGKWLRHCQSQVNPDRNIVQNRAKEKGAPKGAPIFTQNPKIRQ